MKRKHIHPIGLIIDNQNVNMGFGNRWLSSSRVIDIQQGIIHTYLPRLYYVFDPTMVWELSPGMFWRKSGIEEWAIAEISGKAIGFFFSCDDPQTDFPKNAASSHNSFL
jgi:hypothetical protein